MTSDSQKPDPRVSGELDHDSRELCMRYLLGELNDHETAAFESRLALESALGDELISQADLICHVDDGRRTSGRTMVRSTPQRWFGDPQLLRFVVGIAASVFVAILIWSARPDQGPQLSEQAEPTPDVVISPDETESDEDLMIARAWVDGPLSLAPANEPEFAVWNGNDITDVSDESALPDSSDDSMLDWMVAAVSEGANLDG